MNNYARKLRQEGGDTSATTLHAARSQRKLRRVPWLTNLLDLTNDKQTYDAINKGHVPAGCVVRIGRSIRIQPDRVFAWLDGATEQAE